MSIDVFEDIDAGGAVEHGLADIGQTDVIGQGDIVPMRAAGQQEQRGQSWKQHLHGHKKRPGWQALNLPFGHLPHGGQ
jgi:hypothetical protein